MHINSFHLLQEEYENELDCNTIEIEDYTSGGFKSYSLYPKQESGFDVLINNLKALLNRPCGSGKSLITTFATGHIIHHNPNLKAIIAVPQKIITKTFQKKRMIYPNGLQLDWDFQNFCEDDSTNKIQDLVAFLKNKDFGVSFYERVALVSHASLARCYEYIKEEKNIFNNTILAVDETHHVMYHTEKENNDTITNGLGNIINHAITNDDGTNYLWLMTATPFRGDSACIIPDDILSTFAESYLPFHEHWKSMKHLKEIKIDFMLYEQGKVLDYVETVYRNNTDKKILIYCPYNGYLLNGSTKLEFKDHLINLIKKIKPNANILDLVETKDRDQRKMILYDEEKSKTIDVVLNCKIFNEGADWLSNNFVIDLTPSDNLRLSNQKAGRPLRDFEDKEIVTYIYFLPKEAKFANDEERRLHFSKSYNILAASMIVKDQLQPLKYPTKKGVENKKDKYSNLILKVFPNDNKKTQFINKIITKLIKLKEILGKTPKKTDVFSVVKSCLNKENITENQKEITEYILGVIYNFQPNINPNIPVPKKPKWINKGKDISFLIEEGFDKVMQQIYENLLIYSTGVFGVETLEELGKRIIEKDDIGEVINLFNKYGKLTHQLFVKLNKINLYQRIIKRKNEFTQWVDFMNVEEEYIKEAERLYIINNYKKFNSKFILKNSSNNFYFYTLRHKEIFKKWIEFRKLTSKEEDLIAVEKLYINNKFEKLKHSFFKKNKLFRLYHYASLNREDFDKWIDFTKIISKEEHIEDIKYLYEINNYKKIEITDIRNIYKNEKLYIVALNNKVDFLKWIKFSNILERRLKEVQKLVDKNNGRKLTYTILEKLKRKDIYGYVNRHRDVFKNLINFSKTPKETLQLNLKKIQNITMNKNNGKKVTYSFLKEIKEMSLYSYSLNYVKEFKSWIKFSKKVLERSN
jgi:superfamily II DNA or RNA helicase